jgi:hypothetical protein
MDRREVDLLRRLVAAVLDEFFGQLMRIEARIVDRIVVDLGAAVRHPVGDQLAVAGAVLDPDGDAVPEPAHLLALAAGRAAGGGNLQKPVEGMALIVAEFARIGVSSMARSSGSMICSMSRSRCDGESRASCFSRISRGWHMRGLVGLVIAPLDLAALGGLRIAGVAHIGGVALVAQQREADILAGALELVIGPEEGQRVIDRHHRQILADHFGDQAAPETGADDNMVGHDRAAMGDNALDMPSSTISDWAGVLPNTFSLPDFSAGIDQLAGNVCERGMTRPASGSNMPPCTMSSSISGNISLIFGPIKHAHWCRKALPEVTLRLTSSIQASSPVRGHLQPADAGVVAHLVEEIDRVLRRPDRQIVVAGRVAEVRSMRRRADIGRHARLVDADNIVPAALDQVMRDRRADDAAHADDDDLRLFRKLCHCLICPDCALRRI